MADQENEHQIEGTKKASGSHRVRNWTAAGLALGLLAGTGVSLTAASPFAAGASVDSEIIDDRQAMPDMAREGHDQGSAPGAEKMPHRHGPDGRGRLAEIRGEGLRAELLETAATFLEVSPEELRADLRSGSTLAAIAEEQGKSRDDLIAALLAGAIESMTGKLNEFLPRLVDGEIGSRRTS